MIGINQILQGCLLTPQFGSANVPDSWFRGDVLNLTDKFYLNKYLDPRIFELYQQDSGSSL